jgi:hypothetical protein
MTSPVITRAPLKERLVALLAALEYGLEPPPACTDCRRRADEWCQPCAQARDDHRFAGVAIAEIGRPGTAEAEALAIYAKTFLMLTGIKPGEFADALKGGTS